MLGHIKMFNESRGFGFIIGDDGNDYFFHISSVKNFEPIFWGVRVEFSPDKNEKGRLASNVTIQKQQMRKSSFISLGNVRIRISNIKNYGIAKGEKYYIKVYEHSTSSCDSFFSQVILDRYEWHGLKKEVKNPNCWGGKKIIKSRSGEIKPTNRDLYSRKDDIIIEHVDYLYITTFQGDNYRFYETDVSFNIYDKCQEIDQNML